MPLVAALLLGNVQAQGSASLPGSPLSPAELVTIDTAITTLSTLVAGLCARTPPYPRCKELKRALRAVQVARKGKKPPSGTGSPIPRIRKKDLGTTKGHKKIGAKTTTEKKVGATTPGGERVKGGEPIGAGKECILISPGVLSGADGSVNGQNTLVGVLVHEGSRLTSTYDYHTQKSKQTDAEKAKIL